MKKIIYLFSIVMITCIACNDKDNLVPKQDGDETRTEESSDTDSYWSGDRKITLRRCDDLSYVVFRSSNKEALLSSLAEMGIQVDNKYIIKYDLGSVETPGVEDETFLGYEWAQIEINHKKAAALPEVEYAAPYYYEPYSSTITYPLGNLIYVYTSNISLLEKLAEEHKVGIIGKLYDAVPTTYFVYCTKESTGNALEVANLFHENGLNAEPSFLSRRTLGAPKP